MPTAVAASSLSLDETSEPEHDTTVLAVRGELDLDTAPRLCRRIATAPGPRIVVDLSGLSGCDVAGLRALVGAAREARVRTRSVALTVTPRSAIDRLITSTGTREFLPVHGAGPPG